MKNLYLVLGIALTLTGHSQSIYTNSITDYPVFEVKAIETINNVLVVAWMEVDSSVSSPDTITGLDKSIALKTSTNDGISWSSKQIFDNPNFNTHANPTLASDDNGNIYLIFMSLDLHPSSSYDGRLDLYKSIDDGNTWTYEGVVKSSTGKAFPDLPRLIAKGNGELFLVYTNYDRNGSPSLFETDFMKSQDGGQTWSTPIKLSTGETIGPSINFGQNDDLLVSWGTNIGPIYFCKSTDNGNTFQTPIATGTGTQPGWAVTEIISSRDFPQITITYHYPHLLNLAGTISSSDGGATWGALQSHAVLGNLMCGDIDNDGKIHLLFNRTFHDTSLNTFTRVSSDSGRSFSIPVSIYSSTPPKTTLNKYIGAYQSLVCSNANANIKHAFWIDWADNKYHLKYSSWPRSQNFSIGQNSLNNHKVDFYPNPFHDKLHIRSEFIKPGTSYILNTTEGRQVLNGFANGELEIELRLSQIPPGIYQLTIKNDGLAPISTKIVKEF